MIGIIGGSGVYEITQKAESCVEKIVETEYGQVTVSILEIFSKTVAFIPRHAAGHSIPPHKINYRANIDALKNVGVTQIRDTNSVGSMNTDMGPGTFVIPDDFLDFSQNTASKSFTPLKYSVLPLKPLSILHDPRCRHDIICTL